MKHTKEKILEAALDLFNQQGLAQVSLRGIAQALGMSQGNLNYHFKKREDLVEALYLHLVQAMNQGLENCLQEKGLQQLWCICNQILDNFHRYRFFMLDFVQILREHESIRTHYLELNTLRQKQFSMLIQNLVNQELMRKEEFQDEYLYLFKNMQIIFDASLSHLLLQAGQIQQAPSLETRKQMFQIVYPYLSKKGKKSYLKMIESNNK